MTPMEIVCKIVATVVVIFIIVWAGSGLKGCMEEETRKNKIENAQTAAYNARFPDRGDKVELDGVEIVILKKYFWKTQRSYKVRLPNGEITEVMGSEIIDKKPIVSDPNFTER